MTFTRSPGWAFEQLGIGRWHRDVSTGEVRWDGTMHAITGHREALPFEEWVDALAHPDDRGVIRDLAASVRANERVDAPSLRIVRPDGEVRWLRLCGRLEAGPGTEGGLYQGVVLDITDDVLLQQRLARAERLETLGRFSAGVSHNFNNMLMVIGACLDSLQARIGPDADPETTEELDDATDATRRAAKVVAQIAEIAHLGSPTDRHAVEVGGVCETVVRLARHTMPETIGLALLLDGPATVEMVPGSLEQVLQNLVNNARDALIASDTPEPRIELSVQVNESLGAPSVEILVTDNGPGVDPAIEAILFEPFVTTKGHAGTGLGLASAAAIVQGHGGHLAHRRGASDGAEFLVSLPLAGVDAVAPQASSGPPSHAEGGRVLVVDDERAILRAVSRSLDRHGFSVHTADSRRALEALLAEDDAGFDVVLLDRTLGLDRGSELVDLLRARAPGARIFYFTGEPLGPEELGLVEGLIRKPIDMKQLLDILARP